MIRCLLISPLFVLGACEQSPSPNQAPSKNKQPQVSSPSPTTTTASGKPTTTTEQLGNCREGKCWGQQANWQRLNKNDICYLYNDLAVLVSDHNSSSQINIWKQQAPQKCPSRVTRKKPVLTIDGQWQGRIGNHLITYQEFGSDYQQMDIHTLTTDGKPLRIDIGRSTPQLTSAKTIKAILTVGALDCRPTQKDYEVCAKQAWQTMQIKYPDLQKQALPTCTYDASQGIPAAHLSWSIKARVTIKLDKGTPKLQFSDTLKCIGEL